MSTEGSGSGESILVVEGDEVGRRVLCQRLEVAGYRSQGVSTVAEALRIFSGSAPVDLLLVDLTLPDGDGFDLLGRIRKSSDVPMIVVSAVQDQSSKIRALDGGADDYVTKPAHGGELLARIRVALRRRRRPERELLRFDGGLEVDLSGRSVTRHGEAVALTRTEWSLLEELIVRPGILQTHAELLRRVWGVGFEGDSHYLRVYIASLRKKLADEARAPEFIATAQGIGYRWIGEE